jgi:hypothetical protein
MTRSYLTSIIFASNFTTWIISRPTKEPGFNLNQFVRPISADHLLTLTLFNLVRGLTTNIISRGLDPRLMHTDIPSPFTSTQMSPTLLNPALHLPPMTYYPSRGSETMRSSLLVEPCMSILGLDSRTSSVLERDQTTDMASTGLLVWGDPWNAGSWEGSEGFAKRWQWLLCGCTEVLDSTNYWLLQRGEQPLIFNCDHATGTCQR